LAKKFSQEGYNVAMVARSDLSTTLEPLIPNSRSYRCDAGDPGQVERTVQQITADMGQSIHALMYNAGSGVFKTFENTSFEEFEQSWRVGPSGLFLWTKACLPFLKPGESSIAVTGATASWRGMPYTVAFASSKMATRGVAQALARDLGPSKGIHVYHVVIDGVVNLDESTKSDNNEKLSPEHIAETYWQMAQQPQTCWTQEIHIGAAGSFASIASI
jgi:NAD(P)-dependent dehydrogenase (short-subunit alcohol dehydrogenase family)